MTTTQDQNDLLKVYKLQKYFQVRSPGWFGRRPAYIRAVDGISFTIPKGKTLGLVGESGCGKTTTGTLILRLEEPTAGAVYFRGEDIHSLTGPSLKKYRESVQAVFQDPWSSLNPRLRAGTIILEPLKVSQKLSPKDLEKRVQFLIQAVGLHPWQARSFPHEFSGGQRQRIAIARALSVTPQLIVLDEPVSSLDVSVQAQVLNLLTDLQEQYGMSYLLIAHNLGTVQYLSYRVAVMYLGKIVEEALSEELFTHPLHPYTKALISAALPLSPESRDQDIPLKGEIPSPLDPPSGCRFHPRCPQAMKRCSEEEPAYRELGPDHWASCHLY